MTLTKKKFAGWGKQGGSATSDVKRETAKENGKKGGRPKKKKLSKNALGIT